MGLGLDSAYSYFFCIIVVEDFGVPGENHRIIGNKTAFHMPWLGCETGQWWETVSGQCQRLRPLSYDAGCGERAGLIDLLIVPLCELCGVGDLADVAYISHLK